MSAQSYFCIAGYKFYDGQAIQYKNLKLLLGSNSPIYGGSIRF